MDYATFLAQKAIIDPPTGISEFGELPPSMFGFQSDIVKWALRRGRAAIFAGTGLGKSFMELAWGQQVAIDTRRPILHLAPLAVSAQMVREAEKFGIPARQVSQGQDIGEGINITNYHKLTHFNVGEFGGVILDECFAYDTPIDCVNADGSILKKRICDVSEGDKILNAGGTDIVSDVHRREVKYAVAVKFNGKRIVCSPNHPWFTDRGWVCAQDIIPGDALLRTRSAVRMVRENVPCENTDAKTASILRNILLSEMANEPTGDTCEGSRSGCEGEARKEEIGVASIGIAIRDERIEPHSGAESITSRGCERENLPKIESDEPRTFRAWGQWSSYDGTSSMAQINSVRSMDGGVCRVVGETDSGLSHALQAGLSFARSQNRHRGGWSFSHKSEIIGQQEGSMASFVRVDGIEILEPGHSELEGLRDANGSLYFYDLGGTRHPSFSIEGCLVHNSSILKNEHGHFRNSLIEACQTIPFRLAATATPAPNDYMELGNHSEFLGVMSYTDMLATFFVHDGGETQKWRLKGHAEQAFWQWMASWSVMLRKPSDLGYSDEGYILPPLLYHMHEVEAGPIQREGEMLATYWVAKSLKERQQAKRETIEQRVAKAVEITPTDRPFLWWTHLNAEAEMLAKALGAVNLQGSDSEEDKERKILDFCDGKIQTIVTKPSIMGYGINAQVCADTGFLGLNDSWEQFYQSVRRFWRFGQTKPVNCHIIAAAAEGATVANIKRKEADAERMAANMVMHTRDISSQEIRGMRRSSKAYEPQVEMQKPSWLAA